MDRPITPPPPRIRRLSSRRTTLIGSVIACWLVALAGLAWDLTQPAPGAPAAAAPAPRRRRRRPGAAAAAGGGPRRGPRRPRRRGDHGRRRGGASRPTSRSCIEALGTVVPQATVGCGRRSSGVLQQVLFKEGQMVRKGELLATIDPRPFEMALQQATGQRMRDEAQLEAARVTLAALPTLLRRTPSRARRSTRRPRWSSSSKAPW